VDVGDDGSLVVVIRRSSVTGGGRGRHRRRRLDQGHRGAGFLDEGGSRALLLLQERCGGKDSGVGGVVLLLRVDDGGNHGVKFLPELGDLGIRVGVIRGHRRWCRSALGGSVGHRRCIGRREGDRPLGFERSGSEKKKTRL
jgi:hypothetical protein